MRFSLSRKNVGDLLVPFGAGFALLCASLANFLNHNAYPYVRAEVGIDVAMIAAVCSVMAFFYRAQRKWGRSFLEGALAAIFIDLNSDYFLLAWVIGGGVALFTWWRNRSLIGPMAVMGAVTLAATASGIGTSSSWLREAGFEQHAIRPVPSHKPVILHILLDEHIGIEGILSSGPGAARLRQELSSFYRRSGFTVFGGAYSQHSATQNAIPHVLNYGRRLGKKLSQDGVEVGRTEYLTALAKKGFRVTVLQSDFADLCQGAQIASCITYDSSSLAPTTRVPMSATERAALIGLKFQQLSGTISWATLVWNSGAAPLRREGLHAPIFDTDLGRSSTIGALAAMDLLTERLKSAQPGDAYFAHILLPHFPYVVRSDCSYRPWRNWESRRSAAPLKERQLAYDDQVRCTMRKVNAALAALARSPAGRHFVVIVHSDHGSRLSDVDPVSLSERWSSDSDVVAAYSSLFAIRAPDIAPVYRPQRQPMAVLLRDFVESDFKMAPTPALPAEHIVYLQARPWKPGDPMRLPVSWTAPRD